MNNKSAKTSFIPFYFDGNLSWGWINNMEDLTVLFERYKSSMTIPEILEKSHNKIGRETSFGFNITFDGATTLGQFLEKQGINI